MFTHQRSNIIFACCTLSVIRWFSSRTIRLIVRSITLYYLKNLKKMKNYNDDKSRLKYSKRGESDKNLFNYVGNFLFFFFRWKEYINTHTCMYVMMLQDIRNIRHVI